MIYAKKSAVKKRAKELGYRTSPGFHAMLNVAIDCMLTQMVNWTKPAKTFRGDTLAEYLHWHRIRKRAGGK